MACEHINFEWLINLSQWAYSVKSGCTAELRSPVYGADENPTKWYFKFAVNKDFFTTFQLHRETSGEKLQINGTLSYLCSNNVKRHDSRCVMDNDTKFVNIFRLHRRNLPSNDLTLMWDMWITKLPETEEKSVQTLTTSYKVLQDMHAMYRKPEQSDLVLVCEDLEIPVHKCVLSARSPVFAHMFRNVTIESTTENRIFIRDVEPCILEELLQFLYSGWINLSSYSVACDLYYASVKYSVLELKDICREFINSSLSASTVTKTLILAQKCQDQEILENALIFVNSVFEDIESTEAWAVLSKKNQNLEREVLYSVIKMRSKNLQ